MSKVANIRKGDKMNTEEKAAIFIPRIYELYKKGIVPYRILCEALNEKMREYQDDILEKEHKCKKKTR